MLVNTTSSAECITCCMKGEYEVRDGDCGRMHRGSIEISNAHLHDRERRKVPKMHEECDYRSTRLERCLVRVQSSSSSSINL